MFMPYRLRFGFTSLLSILFSPDFEFQIKQENGKTE
jgi:hypothetical protein